MEQDGDQKNNVFFIIGMISLVICLSLLALTLYLLPNLVFGWHYDVPEFVSTWKGWLQSDYDYSDSAAAYLLLLTLFIPALICALITHLSTRVMDNQIYKADEEENPDAVNEVVEEAKGLGYKLLRILGICLLILIGLVIFRFLFNWIYS